jgi:hypothetical protein
LTILWPSDHDLIDRCYWLNVCVIPLKMFLNDVKNKVFNCRQVELTKISYIGTLFKVWFIQDLVVDRRGRHGRDRMIVGFTITYCKRVVNINCIVQDLIELKHAYCNICLILYFQGLNPIDHVSFNVNNFKMNFD